ncbi:5-bromo-4-chloroindolyl phosphate hydrolysis family protein [Methylicorpusculum sp.]|uniref:5-bromo-4-chloroindolyl phosphate hydrolysis family protein n=1 Tax=Methylicorpusculum sp. TaxID=2713644 RepID=UPI0027316166|nr:5-bromo-4-chloroindolyl phosphate hydrolysis family protein [Methylicorpusculum sp.]MDP2180634.1 5-bromo-4-chloroindolyl phosphate hydrolysis family protein [Methylicorpusculum sp.]MDP3530447.1 5-bromo-4-chloroindolyl phosphate hydrolysis family protein [Methylicorpusculum sp.]MDZ4152307.1 5-bromo-4-chloroindolyl phosphate hydrolysis family protein [Methylicorpusculum sp.]
MDRLPSLKFAKRFTEDTLHHYSPRGLLLYFLALALIPAVIIGLVKGHVMSIIVNATGFALYCLAAMLLRRGLAAEASTRMNRWLNATKWPLKLISALLVALTTGLLAVLGAQQSLPVSLIYGVGALLGMYLSYGFDRPKPFQLTEAHGYSGDEIRQTLTGALATIKTIEQANRKILNSELNQRIDSICEIAEGVISELEADPRGIRRARKFLNVYLDSVKQVTEGYAKTHRQSASQELEQNFRQALDAIESAFQEQQQKLLEDDMFDLDVKIEVLTAQLKREGIM